MRLPIVCQTGQFFSRFDGQPRPTEGYFGLPDAPENAEAGQLSAATRK